MKESLQILTIASRRFGIPNPNARATGLINSLRVLGWVPWILRGEFWGFGAKPQMLLAHLEDQARRQRMPEYTLFCDAFDVLFLSDPLESIRHLHNSGGRVLFNGDTEQFPVVLPDDAFPNTGPYRFLNSGFFVGRSDDIITLLRSLGIDRIVRDYKRADKSWHHTNDQEYFLRAFADKSLGVAIDTKAEMCNALYGVRDEDVEFGLTPAGRPAFLNRLTGTRPLAIHANGAGKARRSFLEISRMFGGYEYGK